MDSFEMNLAKFGAPGFRFQERLDFSGHKSGRVLPHINAEVMNSADQKVVRDLTNTQLSGLNSLGGR